MLVSCEDLFLEDYTCSYEGCERIAEKGSIFCSAHEFWFNYNYNQNSSSSNKGSKQCAAYTKHGKRCQRTADKGSIYCWQHK